MELFAIHCATCNARLKVRELAAIGQILACPKCGSMVQVAPPPGWVAPAAGTVASPGDSGDAIHATPSPASAADSNPTARPPATRPAAGGSGANAASVADAEASEKSEAESGYVDWLAPQRRWQRRILLASVVMILLLGILAGVLERSRRRVANTTAPAPQALPRDADENDATHDPSSVAEGDAANDLPPLVGRDYVPRQTRLFCNFRLAEPTAATPRAWFGFLSPLWAGALEAIHESPILGANPLVRFSWLATELDNWDRQGVAIFEFGNPVPSDAALLANSTQEDWSLHGKVVYLADQSPWPHPYAVIGPQTVLTGPEAVLGQLAGRDAMADDSPPSPDAADDDRDPAPPAEADLADQVEQGDEPAPAETEPSTADLPAAEDDTPPPEVSSAELPAAESSGLIVPPAHDLIFVVEFAGDAEAIGHWLPAAWKIAEADGATVPWELLRSAQLSIDFANEAADVELLLLCPTEADASRLEEPLRRQLSAAQQHIARLAGDAQAAEEAAGERGSIVSPVIVADELLREAQLARDGAKIRIRSRVAGDLTALGIAVLKSIPAIEVVRRPAALALGEPRLANFAERLSRGAETDQMFPAAAAGSAILPADTRLSWIATLLPYFGHDDWRQQLNLARSWRDAENQPVTRQSLPAAINPLFGASSTPAGFPVTHYVGISGVGADAGSLAADDPRAGVFGDQPRRWDAVRDGASNTIAVMGVREQWGPWAAGGPSTVKPLTAAPYVNGPDGFGTGQADGMLVGMADGSARFVSSDIDPRVLEQLATINGGETDAIAALDPIKPPALEPPPGKAESSPPGKAPGPAGPPVAQPPVLRDGGLREVDVSARLADPIRALQVTRMPLAQFLELFEGLTTLAVSIDFESIGTTGVAQLPVTLKIEDMTAQQLLEQALAEHGLVLSITQDQLAIRAGDASAPARRDSYDVSDLVAAAGDQPAVAGEGAPLAVLVRQLVAPATWTANGGAGTATLDKGQLVVEQPPVVQRQIVDLLDRLRTARGKSKLTAAEAQTRLAPPWSVIQHELELPLSVNFLDDTPLLRILAYLKEKTGIDFVVDWRALGEAKIGPDVTVGLHVQNQPLAVALEALLAPLGLAFRPIDGRTMEISTPRALAGKAEIDFYPLRPLASTAEAANALAARLTRELSPASWQGKPPAAVAVVDVPSRYLIVRGDAALQRQVAATIQQWRAAAGK